MNLRGFEISRTRFTEIAEKFPKRTIMVVGDVGIDRYTIGEATRLNPEAPVPVVAVSRVNDKLGLASNVADNIVCFGAKPMLVSLIGEDRYGEELCELLKQKNISSQTILKRSSRKTTMKERIVANNQQVVRVDYEGTGELTKADEDFIWPEIERGLATADAVIIEDYSKGVITQALAQRLIRKAREMGKLVAVDPPSASHMRYRDAYRGASLITPNLQEAEKLTGLEIRNPEQVREAGEKLLNDFSLDVAIITQGKDGMTIFRKGEEPMRVPTFARAVFDVSGAGDTVISMLVLAMTAGASLKEAAILGNFAAGVVVGKPGTATVTVQELRDYMEQTGGLTK